MSATTTVQVAGMTCDHCVSAVTEELSTLSGVTDVHVDLVPGGSTTVVLTSEQSLSDDLVAAAVDEAGYEVVR